MQKVDQGTVKKENLPGEGIGEKVEHGAEKIGEKVKHGAEEGLGGKISDLAASAKEKLSLYTDEPPANVEKMKAIMFNGRGSVVYGETNKPRIREPKDVLIKVTGSTICGSDLHLYQNEIPGLKWGDVLGHEFMGIVEEVGPAVTKIRKGQRVVNSFNISCGDCEFCQREEYTACLKTNPSVEAKETFGTNPFAGMYGYSHLSGGYAGGQAEYVRIPYGDMNLLVLPDDVPDEVGLYLSDIVPTSLHACECANVKKGDVVGIWGLGPIGLMAARWCQVLGAEKIIGIDNVPKRLEIAKQLGIETLNFQEEGAENLHKKLVALSRNGVGLDGAIDATGFRYAQGILHPVARALQLETDTPQTVNEILRALRPFGHLGLIADYVGTTNGFAIGTLMMKHIHIAGGQSPTQKYWKRCLEAVQQKLVDPTFILTHKITLSQTPEFYKKFNDKSEGVIKVFIRPDDYIESSSHSSASLSSTASSTATHIGERVGDVLSSATSSTSSSSSSTTGAQHAQKHQ